jgi:putative ABC transport system ATP-binding protein
MDLLRRSCDELGQTIVVVTHDPRAAAYADRVVFLSDGQIIREIACNAADTLDQRLSRVMDAMETVQM